MNLLLSDCWWSVLFFNLLIFEGSAAMYLFGMTFAW